MRAKVDDKLASSAASLMKLGRALMASGDGAKAVSLFRRLLADRPNDPDLLSAAKAVLSRGVPQWHASMLRDSGRNETYERAIGRAVRSADIVLDIGSGSGLLAMMAARAGARHVYSCEANPAIAETAREIVAVNGLSDRVTIFAKHSSDLDAGRDLGGGADIVVSEIFAMDLLGEGALASLDHAARDLARPNARFIPSEGTLRVALAYRDFPPADLPTSVSGFDVSLFDRHIAPHQAIAAGHKRLHLRSPAEDLFTFRFGPEAPATSDQVELVLRSNSAPVNGVVQWIRLRLDQDEVYENVPAPGVASHWAALFHPLPDQLASRASDGILVNADHQRGSPRLWFEAA